MKHFIFIKTLKNGEVIQYPLEDILTLPVEAGSVYSVIDKSTGARPDNLVLKRRRGDLEIEIDQEQVAIIEGFYQEDVSCVYSVDGSAAPPESMSVTSADPPPDQADMGENESAGRSLTDSEHGTGQTFRQDAQADNPGDAARGTHTAFQDHGMAGDTAGMIVWQEQGHDGAGHIGPDQGGGLSGGTLLAMGASLAGIAAVAAAANSGGSSSGGSGEDEGASIIQGTITMGPIIPSHTLELTVYDMDGNILGSDWVDMDGTYRVVINADYTGPVLVRVIDHDNTGDTPSSDYLDEGLLAATGLADGGAEADLTLDLRATRMVQGEGTYTVNINALTELAVRELGLVGGDKGESGSKLADLEIDDIETAIQNANESVAKAFGLTDIIETEVEPIVKADGTANENANDYGKILAAVSGMEQALREESEADGEDPDQITAETVIARLTESLSDGKLSDDAVVEIVQGAKLITESDNVPTTDTGDTDDTGESTDIIEIADLVGYTAPEFTSPQTDNADENQAVLYAAKAGYGQAEGDHAEVTYSLKSGSGDESLLDIDAETGVVSLKTGNLDYESVSSYTFTVIADNGIHDPVEQAVTIIVYDEITTVSVIGNVTVTEGDSGTATVSYTFSRTGDLSPAVVDYSVSGTGDNAADSDDFDGGVLPSGTVAFAAGEDTKTIEVLVAGDTVLESDEGFTLQLSQGTPQDDNTQTAVINPDAESVVTTIANDDSQVSVTGQSTVTEGDSGTATVSYTVTRTGDLSRAAVVDYQVTGTGENAADADDFDGSELPSGTVTFAVGEDTKTIEVQVTGDTLLENDEAFTLQLSQGTPSNADEHIASINPEAASVQTTINNDDTLIEGRIVLGPLVGSHTLEVSVFDTDGNVLGSNQVNPDGTYEISIDGSYTGTVLVRVVDTDSDSISLDYMDEGSEAQADLVLDLRAVTTIPGLGGYTINANAVTELAVRELGLEGGDKGGSESGLASLEIADIETAIRNVNTIVSEAFGLADIIGADIEAVINADGSVNLNANDYGRILAALSGLEQVLGGEAQGVTAETVVAGLVEALGESGFTDDAIVELIQGAQQVFEADSQDVRSVSDLIGYSAPTFRSLDAGDADENQDILYSASAAFKQADTDHGEVTYSLKPGQGAESFLNIDSETGIVTFKTGHFDFESVSGYTFTVLADNGIHDPVEQVVTVQVNDISESGPRFSVFTETLGSLNSPSAGETVSVEFTITRTSGDGEASVAWELGNIAATDFEEGILPSGVAEFQDGVTTMTISVEVPGSLTLEISREAVLSLTDPTTGAQIDPDNFQAAVTIVDTSSAMSEGVVTFNLSSDVPTIVQEGADQEILTITYTVTRSDSTGALDLGYSLVATGAALLDSTDFQGSTSGTIQFADGADTAQFTIQMSGDDQVGPDESFRIVLGDETNPLPAGAQVVGNTGGTIVNDDAYVSAGLVSVEDAGPGKAVHNFVITRSGAVDKDLTVTYTIIPEGEQGPEDLDASLDNALAGAVTFEAGETEKVITVDPADNTLVAGYQTFALALDPGDNITLINDTAVSTLAPNLQEITVTAITDRALEGTEPDTALTFEYTVTRSGNTDEPCTLTWEVAAGDGEHPADADDFEGNEFPSDTLEFAAGEFQKTISFTAAEDAVLDGEEFFVINISSEQAEVRILTPGVQGTIVDDESAVGLSDNAAFSVVEGDSGSTTLVVTASRIGFAGMESTVEWRLSPETATSDDFEAGQDLLGDNNGLPSGTVTFLTGETSAAISIQVATDSVLEADETVTITLDNPSAGTQLIGTDAEFDGYGQSATATIANDDAVLSMADDSIEYVEGNGGGIDYMQVTVNRTGSTDGEDTVTWKLWNGIDGNSADNEDLGDDNSAVAEYESPSDSWIELASLSGTQSTQGTVELPGSGYILVAYNRDEDFVEYDGDNTAMPFDRFLVNGISVNNGATLTALGPVVEDNAIADDVALTDNAPLFSNAEGMALPEGGCRVVISSDANLAGIYFKVTGTDDGGEALTEIIQGPGRGSSATLNAFTAVTGVEAVETGIAVGVKKEEGIHDENSDEPTAYFSNLDLTLDGGDLITDVSSEEHLGAQSATLGYVTITSEADLSGTTFEVTGGITVGYFDATDGISSAMIGDGEYDYTSDFAEPVNIICAQVSFEGQSDDGSADPHYFMITGENQAGERISEIVQVDDITVESILEDIYSAGAGDSNLLNQVFTPDTAGELLITVEGGPFELSEYGTIEIIGTDEYGNSIQETITLTATAIDSGTWTENIYAAVTAINITEGDDVYTLDIAINTTPPTTTVNAFSKVYGIAPVDENGLALENNEIPEGSGRFEFYVPKTFVIEGNAQGVAIGEELVNYIEQITAVRPQTEDLSLDIGYIEDDSGAELIEDMLVTSDETGITGVSALLPQDDDINEDTGNPAEDGDEDLSWAIFKVDTENDQGTSLSFDMEILGRYGIDTASISYSPSGTFSENVFTMEADDSLLLIDPLTTDDPLAVDPDITMLDVSDMFISDEQTIEERVEETAGKMSYMIGEDYPADIAVEILEGHYGFDLENGLFVFDNGVTEDDILSFAVAQNMIDSGTLYYNIGSDENPEWIPMAEHEGSVESVEGATYLFFTREELERGVIGFEGSEFDTGMFASLMDIEGETLLPPGLLYSTEDATGIDSFEQGYAGYGMASADAEVFNVTALGVDDMFFAGGEDVTLERIGEMAENISDLFGEDNFMSEENVINIFDEYGIDPYSGMLYTLESSEDDIQSFAVDRNLIESGDLYYNIGTEDDPQWIPLEDHEGSAASFLDSTYLFFSREELESGVIGFEGDEFETGFGLPFNLPDTPGVIYSTGDYTDLESFDSGVAGIGSVSVEFDPYADLVQAITVDDLLQPANNDIDKSYNSFGYVAFSNYGSDLEYNAGTTVEPDWITFSQYESDNETNWVAYQDVLDGALRFTGDEATFDITLYVKWCASEEDWTTSSGCGDSVENFTITLTHATAPATAIAQGSVTLDESGYIWVRYANVADSVNDGVDQAWINDLHVSDGATLTVAGNKVITDGIATTQNLGGAGSIELNGSAAADTGIDLATNEDSLYALLQVTDGLMSLYSGSFSLVGTNSRGETVTVEEDWQGKCQYVEDGNSRAVVISTDDLASIESLRVLPFDTSDWNQASPLELNEINFSLVSGDLDSLTANADVSPMILTDRSRIEFDLNSSDTASIPGAPVDVDYDNSYFESNSGTDEGYHCLATGVFLDGSTDQALIGSTIAMNTAGRIVISTHDDLTGQQVTITGTLADGTQNYTETITLGDYRDYTDSFGGYEYNTTLGFTDAVFSSVDSITTGDQGLSGQVNIVDSMIFDEPMAAGAMQRLSYSDTAVVDMVVTGLDRDGNLVRVAVDEDTVAAGIKYTLGEFSEIFDIQFASARYEEVYVFIDAADGSYDGTVEESLYNDFVDIPLNTAAVGDDGLVVLEDPQRIIISVATRYTNHNTYRVIGWTEGMDPETDDPIIEDIVGLQTQVGAGVTENYFTVIQAVQVTGALSNRNTDTFHNINIGTIGEPILETDIDRYGQDLVLGNTVAEFGTASLVTFTSEEDISDRSFTITGTLADGTTVTETVTGPDDGIVYSNNAYMTVTDVQVSDGSDGSVQVGYATVNGALVDDFVITGSGTEADPFVAYSTNTLENKYLYDNWELETDETGAYSEAGVLLYLDLSGTADGTAELYYDLGVQGAAGDDILYIEFSPDEVPPLLTGTAVFEDGADTTVIEIPIVGDDTREPNESLILTLEEGSTGTTIDNDADTTDITIINDDDVVTLETVLSSAAEGNEDNGVIEFTVTRLDAGPEQTIDWEISGLVDQEGNPIEGAADADDFPALSGTAIFAQGETTTVIQVATRADRIFEGDETFQLVLSEPESGSGYILNGNTTAEGIITNDDASVSITADAPSVAEGDEGTVSHTFTVTRTGDLSQASSLDWAVTGSDAEGMALAATAVDFDGGVLPSGTLTFEAGETGSQNTETQTITINTIGDETWLGNRGFTVTLYNHDTDTSDITGDTSLGLIYEDDSGGITIDPVSITEGTGESTTHQTLTLTREGDTSRALTVDWEILSKGGEVPVYADDFDGGVLPSGRITFEAGAATTELSFDIVADDLVEPDESMTVRLSSPYSDAAPQDQVLTLLGDDQGFGLQVSAAETAEGTGDGTELTLNFIRMGNTESPAEYTFEMSGVSGDGLDAANADDFGGTLAGGTVSFGSGETAVTRVVTITGDSDFELDEGFKVTLKDGAATLAESETVIISNDDAKIGITVDKVSFTEGSVDDGYEVLTYTFTRQGNLTQESSVDWAVAAGSADIDDFFAAFDQDGTEIDLTLGLPAGTIVFAEGETEQTITLQVTRDSMYEADETVTVTLSNPSSGTSIDGSASQAQTGVINDDAQVAFEVSSLAVSGTETDPETEEAMTDDSYTTLIFNVERTGVTTGTSTVDWELVYDGEADSGDFTGDTSGTISFAADETSKSVSVRVLADHYGEGDETFSVLLSNPGTGTSIGDADTAVGTIEGDDVGIYLADTQSVVVKQGEGLGVVDENGDQTDTTVTTFTWDLVRIGDTTEEITINYAVGHRNMDGYYVYDYSLADYRSGWYGAIPDVETSDFVAGNYPTGTVTFAAGESTATLSIDIVGDNEVETSEAFKVALTRPEGLIDFNVNTDNPLADDADTQYLAGIIVRDEALVTLSSEIVSADDDTSVYISSAKAEGDEETTIHYFKLVRELSDVGDLEIEWRVSGYDTAFQSDVYDYLAHNRSTSADVDDFVSSDELGDNNGLPSGTVTILDGETQAVIAIETSADLTAEDIESFRINMGTLPSGNSYTPGGNYCYGYIGADDAVFSVGMLIADDGIAEEYGSKVIEEGQSVTFRVYRSGDTVGEASVDWTVTYPDLVEDEATSYGYTADSSDFADGQVLNGTLTFADGEAYKEISLTAKADGSTESWAEGFAVELSNAVNGGISETAGTMESLIIDQDAPASMVSVTAEISNSGMEGTLDGMEDTAVTYTLTRAGDTSSVGQIAWTLTTNGYPSDVASIIGDTGAWHDWYHYWSGLVTFDVGETSKSITVNIDPDVTVEADEDIVFTLVDARSILDISDTTHDAGYWNYGNDGTADLGIDTGIEFADSSWFDSGDIPDSGSMLRDPDAYRITTTIENDDVRIRLNHVNDANNLDARVFEGNDGTTDFNLSLTRYGDQDGDITLGYEVILGTAGEGDVIAGSGILTLEGGQSNYTKTLSIITADLDPEADETFTLRLTSGDVNVKFGQESDASGSADVALPVTILNDDTEWSVTSSAPSQSEGDAGETAYVFTVSRPADGTSYSGDASVNWQITGGDIDASDFKGDLSGTVSFAENVFEKDVIIKVTADKVGELDENFTFELIDADHGVISAGNSSVAGAIINDDQSVSISDVQTIEGQTDDTRQMVFTVTRAGDLTQAASADWAVTHDQGDGTTNALDFAEGTTLSGTVSFIAVEGETSGTQTQTITLDIQGDDVVESDETLEINLSGLSLGLDGLDTEALGTIANDDTRFTITADAPVNEGDGTGQAFTISRSVATVQDQTVNWTVSSDGGSHGAGADDFSDSTLPSGTLTFTGDELTKTIYVKSLGDETAELDESFIVTLTAGDGVSDAMLADGDTAYGYIPNDDGAPDTSDIVVDSSVGLSGAAQADEGEDGTQTIEFTVNRAGTLSYDTTVDWHIEATSNGGGTDADVDDFGGSLPSGTLTLLAGESSAILSVSVSGDIAKEENETFTLVLENPGLGTELTEGAETAQGTISNDDDQMSIADASNAISLTEGEDGTLTFTIIRSGDASGQSTVEWQIVTPEGNPYNGSDDFDEYLGSVTFEDGETSKIVNVTVNDDEVSEADEPFTIELVSSDSGVDIDSENGSRSVIIGNDDADAFSIAADTDTLNEGNNTGEYNAYLFTVTRENPATTATVTWTTEAGTGDHPFDVTSLEASSGQVSFDVGELEKTFTVNLPMDQLGDWDRTFDVTLSDPTTSDAAGAVLDVDTASVTILNDDPALYVSLVSQQVSEDSGAVRFTIFRTGDAGLTASVDWELSGNGDEAASFKDFEGYWPSGTAEFGAGETEKQISVLVSNDNTFEADEGFKITLSNADGADIIMPDGAVAQGTLVNDDNGVSVTADTAGVVEGDSGTVGVNFNITAQGIAGETILVAYVVEGTGTSPANADDFDSGYGSGSCELTIGEDGTATTQVSVSVSGDTKAGQDETFRLRITDIDNGQAIDAEEVVVISNDDSQVSISGQEIIGEADEGTTSVRYTVTRTGDLTRAAVVDYEVTGFGDNAAVASDFEGDLFPSGTLTFAENEDTQYIDVLISGDTVFESDESFAVELSQGTQSEALEHMAAIDPAGARALTTIVNDDLADLIVTRLNAVVNEGSDAQAPNAVTYQITRNGDCSQELTVNYQLIADPDNGGADTLPGDGDLNDSLSGSVTIAAGESGTILSLEVAPDSVPESNLYFLVQVSADGFDDPDAVSGSIFDDDTGISAAYDTSVDHEDYTEYQFTVTRTGDTDGVVNVTWEASGIGVNPVDDDDFASDFVEGTLTSGTITLQDGTAQTTCSVYLTNDTFVENNETLRFTLTENLTSPDDLPILTADADVTIESTIAPTDGDDLIYGGLGPDTIEALAGNDTIHAGDGTDVIYGGEGNDIIHAGQGADIVYGGDGDDVIYGDGGADAVYAGDGNDEIVLNSDNVDGFDESLQTFVDGGLGTDSLTLDGSGMELDFTATAQDGAVRNIDIIDMSGDGANRLVADVSALAAQDKEDTFDTGLSDEDIHQLMVEGDDDDTLEISDLNDWARVQNEDESDFTYTYNGSDYHVYNHADGAEQLIVNVDIIIVDDTLV
ncbi:Calx-beta domain-containing protein [uncultured Desulfobacter sp.]|uniref:Calx-beta domain-containing protein n=1 Tax=uncultured Desulfobacter sp. TaxID=240139 RepID=UPI002AA92BB9|nr:Calx-beta domain-containing protein [uncultured Desulfobacter sp.]